MPMEFVDVFPRVAVQVLVGRRDDQQSFGLEHACKLGNHLRLVGRVEVLDGLERYNSIHRSVRQGQRRTGADDEADAITLPVALAGMGNGGGGDVDRDDALRHGSKECAAISLTAGSVEHPLAGGEPARKRVPVPMLVGDFAGAAGYKALSGERDIGSHAGTVPRAPMSEAPRKTAILPDHRVPSRPLAASVASVPACQRCAMRTRPSSRVSPSTINDCSMLSNSRTPSRSSACARIRYLPGNSGSSGNVSMNENCRSSIRIGATPSMSEATPYIGVPSARTTPSSITGPRPSGANTLPSTVNAFPDLTRASGSRD